MESVHLQLSEELLARIDAERGMVARNRWIRWAVEQALGTIEAAPALSGHKPSLSSPAPAEQPSHSGPKDVYRGPEVEAEWRARSSSQAKRNVRPVPKAKP